MIHDRRSSSGYTGAKPSAPRVTNAERQQLRATGRLMEYPEGERLSEFFDADRAHLPVRRFELQAIMQRWHDAHVANRWYNRLWRWLKGRLGSSTPAVRVPPATEERGEELRAELERELHVSGDGGDPRPFTR